MNLSNLNYFSWLLIFFISHCQTFSEAKKDREILEKQESLILNYLNQGKAKEAFTQLRELLRDYPDRPTLNNLMGLTQISLGNPNLAIRHLNKAYQKDPSPHVALNFSSALIQAGQYKNAKKILNAQIQNVSKGQEKYIHVERLYHNLALVYENEKKTNQAVKFYKKALEENPSFYLSLMQLGHVYNKVNKKENAFNYFKLARESCPNCFEPIEGMYHHYVAKKNRNAARKILDDSLKQEGLPLEIKKRGLALKEK